MMTASSQTERHLPQPAKQSARQIAFSILLDIETQAAYASELLHARLRDVSDSREVALATELVMGTLRWQRSIDFWIEQYAGRAVAALDEEVLIAIRMGIYQLRHLARVPPRAAVNESVQLIRRSRKESAAALGNAVLRRAANEKSSLLNEFLPAGMNAIEALALQNSHPTWMVERWLRNFGEQKTAELLRANNRTPSRACTILLDEERREEALRSLEESGIQIKSGRLVKNAVLIEHGGATRSAAFRKGWITMQDEASQMIPLLLDVQPGDTVLDVCAAPGGKTMTLAKCAGACGKVVACDTHEARLRMMRERLEKAGIQNVLMVTLDGTGVLPFSDLFDRMLVDAPCSGTGTLARNPEIRWRLREDDLPQLHRRQVALLASAMKLLAPRGLLVYSTCSLEPEENEAVVQEALASNSDFCTEPLPIAPSILAEGIGSETLTDSTGAFRTFPPEQHTDGFFAAAIRRR